MSKLGWYVTYPHPQLNWFMGEEDEVLGELHVMWVESQVLQWETQGNQEVVVVGSDPEMTTDSTITGVSNLPCQLVSPEGQLGNTAVNEPTGVPSAEGVCANAPIVQVAAESAETSFHPQLFWRMLAQIGYGVGPDEVGWRLWDQIGRIVG